MDKTPVSLLERLRLPGQFAAWDRLVDLYAPLIHFWVRAAGLQDADAADLVQDTFLLLRAKLPEFQYDPSGRFRGWLRTLALNCWRNQRRKRQPLPLGDHGDLPQPDPVPAFWEREYQQILVGRALAIMQRSFKEKTWQACWMVTVEGLSHQEVAARLEMKVGAVYTAICRVLARMRVELAGMLE